MSKPAAKPAARKSKRAREASLDDSDASMTSSLAVSLPSPLRDLTNSKNSRKKVASALLSILPDGATKQSAAAKKLASAFPLVVAELEARSKALARKNESEGTHLPIAFSFDDTVINMPEECFVNVLKFLKGTEIVSSSLVSKVWLSASRLPALWERLDKSTGLTNKSKKLNMTSLIKLLQRPHFENLKFLQLPYKVKLGKNSVQQIAKACPHLGSFDVTNLHVHDGDLMEIVTQFPSLSSLRTEMWNATSFGIATAVSVMGDQLLDLRIQGDTITRHYLNDGALRALAASCPNLKHFTYMLSTYDYREQWDTLSGAALKAVVESCRRLEVLRLLHVKSIKKADFASILELLDGASEGEFALRDIDLHGYPFWITGNPLRIEDGERPDGRRHISRWNVYDLFAA